MDQKRLTHLRQLEAESIHIIREVAAEFSNPVMMYSIGKDSSVMLHLARKAFYPGTLPFPLLHVDTGWKFREMYEFRDRTAKAYGCELLVLREFAGTEDTCALPPAEGGFAGTYTVPPVVYLYRAGADDVFPGVSISG